MSHHFSCQSVCVGLKLLMIKWRAFLAVGKVIAFRFSAHVVNSWKENISFANISWRCLYEIFLVYNYLDIIINKMLKIVKHLSLVIEIVWLFFFAGTWRDCRWRWLARPKGEFRIIMHTNPLNCISYSTCTFWTEFS